MTNRPIVFLDTETNGLHADRRPWEIAWIRRDVDGTETERCIQIADVDNTDAQPQALEVGGFDERWKGGPQAVEALYASTTTYGMENPYKDVYLESEAAHVVYAATRNAIIVGNNPRFDTETLAEMFRRHRLCPRWHYQLVDVVSFAAGWLAANSALTPPSDALTEKRTQRYEKEQQLRDAYEDGKIEQVQAAEKAVHAAHAAENLEWEKSAAEFVAPPWRSDELSRACGVEPPNEEERHTALGDARWVKRWYDHIIGSAA